MTYFDLHILIVIVIYKENIYNTKTYKSLIKGNDVNLFIYDNSPNAQHKDIDFPPTWKYVSNPSNPGLSYAYNCAAEYGKKHNFEWILLADQDTLFAPNILFEYEESILQHPNIKLFAPPILIGNQYYISPLRTKYHMAKRSTSVPCGENRLAEYTLINSGMMINIKAFFDVDGYNEKVRIDYSDYQFIERFCRKYDKFFILNSICYQEFSNIVQSPQQKLHRYISFCDSIKNCEKSTYIDKVIYLYIVVKRMITLIFRTRTLKPIATFIKYYL